MGLIISFFTTVNAQNSAEKILGSNKGLNIGGYGQIDYNRVINSDINYNATLDVHRIVTFIGYNFNDKTSFVSEIEMEHVTESYVEQAFLIHRIKNNISVNAGLMLIPMGIQNLYHEPPTFNGVERTNVDKYIVPTTWREMGVSVNGRVLDNTLTYEIMLVNGFNGFDGESSFSGKSGLRGGRQKGAKSYMTHPDLATRFVYTAVPGLNIGFSVYLGESESKEYNGLDLTDESAVSSADSTIIGINMFGLDSRYNKGAFQFRAQYILGNLSNTAQYNVKTSADVGSVISGYYSELGYNILNRYKTENKLITFARFENYNTHKQTDGVAVNSDYDRTDITFGVGFKVAYGAMFKVDYQIKSDAGSDTNTYQLNLGTAIWF